MSSCFWYVTIFFDFTSLGKELLQRWNGFDEQTSPRPYFEHSSKLTWLIRDFTIQDRLKVDITSSMSKFHASRRSLSG